MTTARTLNCEATIPIRFIALCVMRKPLDVLVDRIVQRVLGVGAFQHSACVHVAESGEVLGRVVPGPVVISIEVEACAICVYRSV